MWRVLVLVLVPVPVLVLVLVLVLVQLLHDTEKAMKHLRGVNWTIFLSTLLSDLRRRLW